ncbi:UNVERIFIED_ORG: maltose alpha-D-glucosyltransferase/alpha-amylase [Xanthobacter viscosus]|uniref:maltose alpha-D-glucosyltransferase n=1 Tax=Xanthobacter autotrophicus TaxID=280 RepID=A0A6C1KBA3_XANAU|nr:maltose alpha-D-glucosyltransferase [Xanthobacter autotrophicus]TLX40867.1 maltose alpha-D-glucosyltransferase [Xanthobacter autotrophicus]
MPEPVTAGDDPLWYKDAIIYQLHVKSFFDANDDGIGDFRGLISKLDYIADLGATAVWLLPFYPSPRRDDGYDISLYEGVSPDYGTMDEARRFIAEAHARGLRVITELVINHTSDQHPWFQAARRAPKGSPERNFYVWADDDKGYPGVPIVFCDVEKSNWTYDEVAGQFYWHRFYSHQPDLNFDNPEVLEHVLSIMRFWLDLGVDGLRLDAVPYLVEREGTDCGNLPETHAILKQIRAHLDAHYTGRMLLAEANLWPEDTQQYFGADADECHMAFHFPIMPRMYMAIAKEDRFPITDILRQTPEIPPTCQWAIFLRNHDELTLETVTDSERDYLWSVYAADRRARINLGIRRRLAPLLERDRRRMELMNSLLLTLPGTPVIYYGDEIGMGDNIHLGDRDGVRTPMQWSPDRNGGFSKADPERLVLPVIQDPLYGYGAVNVEAQSRDAHSLLNWTRRFLAVRRQHVAFGRGTFRLLFPRNRRILAYLRELEGEAVLCVANLAHTLQAVELDLAEFERRVPVDLVSGTSLATLGRAPFVLTLPPYGFYAFSLSQTAAEPSWRDPAPEALPEFATLVVRDGLMGALGEPHRAVIEKEALPAYLARRRWFEGRADAIGATRLGWAMRLPGTERDVVLAEIEAEIAGTTERYLMPLCIAWEDQHPPAIAEQLALTRVRQGRRVGFLTDAAVLDGLAAGVVRALREDGPVPLPDGGAIVFSRTDRLDGVTVERGATAELIEADEPAANLVITSQVAVKLFRHMTFGHTAEEEMARHLTALGLPHVPPLLGAVTRTDPAGAKAPLALVYGHMQHQGNAADWTMAQLQRALDAAASTVDGARQRFEDEIAGMMALLRNMGRRLGELHAALSIPSDDVSFTPQEASPEARAMWRTRAEATFAAALDVISRLPASDGARPSRLADLHGARAALVERLGALYSGAALPVIRIHGRCDLHHMLVAGGDALIVGALGGLEGVPEGERAPQSPWRDVAELLAALERAAARSIAGGEAGAARDAPELRAELVAAFLTRAERAVLGGYLERAPTGATSSRAFADAFVLEALAHMVVAKREQPHRTRALVAGLHRQTARLLKAADVEEAAALTRGAS